MTLLFFSSVPVGFIPQTDPNERKLSTGPPVESSHYNNHFFLHQMTAAVVATAKIPEKYALYSITMMLRSNKHCGGIHKLWFQLFFLNALRFQRYRVSHFELFFFRTQLFHLMNNFLVFEIRFHILKTWTFYDILSFFV